MKQTPELKVSLLAVLCCLIWSSAFFCFKIGLRHSAPLSFGGLRFILAGLILFPFCCKKTLSVELLRRHFGALCKIAFYQTFLVFALVYTAMSRVPGAVGAIIIGSSPLTTAVVAHFLADDDHMSSGKTAGLLMGVSGVVVLAVSRNPLTPTGFYESIGILLLVTATIVSAYGNILVSRHQTGIDPIGLNAVQLFLGGVFLFLFSLPLEGFPPLHRFPSEYFGALVWLAAVSAFALSLWFYLLQQPEVKVSDVNFWKFLIPVSGALLSWAVLPEESPAPAPVAGMVLIAFSIIIHNRVQAHHRKTTAKQKIAAAAPKT